MLKVTKQMVPSILALRQAGHASALTHGNGPQVGELALERSAATFDVLGAESQGQIGYALAQAFQSAGVDAAHRHPSGRMPATRPLTTLPNTSVRLRLQGGGALANQLDWTIKQDGEYYRSVVASPKPIAVLQLDAARTLLENNYPGLVVAGGGGGAPVSRVFGDVVGVEAVVDKDATGALMARELEADGFIILTDGGGIWHNFGKPDGREMKAVTPKYLKARKTGQKFPGSMGPKISAIILWKSSSNQKAGPSSGT